MILGRLPRLIARFRYWLDSPAPKRVPEPIASVGVANPLMLENRLAVILAPANSVLNMSKVMLVKVRLEPPNGVIVKE